MDNSYFSYGDMIIFEVSVKSNSNNSVQLIWISDKDNEIGSNSSFNTNTLSLGEHEITVLAEFEKDLTLTSSINIFVEERNKNAVANIIPPEYDSLWYYNSEIVNFTVTVVDTIGNPINDYTCKWISSIDGLISKNNYFGVNSLSPGIHDLDLTVFFKDSTISKDSLQNITIVDDPYVGTGLLNDKQMLNEFDPDAPTVIEEWKNWTRGNSQPIRSIFSSNFKDLHFIDSYISNARIVQMGEVSHGAANQNRSRVRLIKYLHEELGFNVVAFESGFYEAYFSNIIITTMSDIDAMRNSISGRWNTLELFDLIRYVKSTHSSNNPLHIAGFDVKPSTLKILSRPGFFRDLMNIIDTEFAEDILLVDTKVVMYYRNRQTAISYVQQNYAELCQKYDHLIELIENYYSVFLEYYDIETVSIALEAAKSAREAINNINGNAYYQRDHQMAKTIIYLANELYENEKIIIWAHNVHVLKNRKS
jgi:hypothetical protein